ncbi:MAG: SDR family oxidoreductase [Caldilineaceae bacterium]
MRADYGATKHGVLGLTKSAAVEYAAQVHPVPTPSVPAASKTPMVTHMLEQGWITMDDMVGNSPIRRIGRPEEIAAAVLWLCSPARASSSATPSRLTAASMPNKREDITWITL